MTPEDAKRLLGGYATGTLTDAEQQALFAAALEDQELFDTLAREQSLRAVLSHPAAKAHHLPALDKPRANWWWSWRPAVAALAMAGVAVVAVVVVRRQAPAPVPQTLARADAPALPFQAPAAQPAPMPPPPAVLRAPGAPARDEADSFRRRKVDMAAATPAQEQPKLEGAALATGAAELAKELEKPAEKAANAAQDTRQAAETRVEQAAAAPPPTVTLVPDMPKPVRAQMFADQAVAVTTGNLQAQAAAGSARALFLGTPRAQVRLQPASTVREAGSQSIGLRYSILRREGAQLVDADPQDLKQGETLVLRFTANVNGYLSVAGATPVALTAMQPYTTPPLASDEIKVVFARLPQTALATAMAPLTEVAGRETYVANALPSSPLGFTIALKRK
jgi:hypothetical protein